MLFRYFLFVLIPFDSLFKILFLIALSSSVDKVMTGAYNLVSVIENDADVGTLNCWFR